MSKKRSRKKQPRFFECQLCGECCSKYCVPITHFDLKRILDFLGLPPTVESIESIVEFIEPDESVEETYEDIPRPLLEDYETPALILVLKSDEYCDFYSNNEKGCTIYPARPLVCRFFPFTYEYEEVPDYSNPPDDLETYPVTFTINEDSNYCPGIKKGTEYDFDLLTKLTHQTTREDAEFEHLINIWNIEVLFCKRLDYDQETFFKYLIDHFPDA
ncbi:MAG: YkgJ family cysteine cluster protein [Candidatus Helarchaeales archaeon]